MPYFRTYQHRGHNGTRLGHAEWKSAGELYFASEKEYLLSRILNETFDPMPLVESWPFRPENWTPTIIGQSKMLEDGHEDEVPTKEDIELDEVLLLSLEDSKEQMEESLAQLKSKLIVQTPMKRESGEDETKSPEPVKSTEDSNVDHEDIRVRIQGIETDILKCRVKVRKLKTKIAKDQEKLSKVNSARESKRSTLQHAQQCLFPVCLGGEQLSRGY